MRFFLVLLLAACLLPGSRVHAEETGTVTGMPVNVYEQMDDGSGVVGNVVEGSTFTVLGTAADADGQEWCHIRTDFGVEGYIPASVVISIPVREDIQPQPEVQPQPEAQEQSGLQHIVTTDITNIRELPTTDSEILGRIPVNTDLQPLQVEENEAGEIWYRITYDGAAGYIKETAVNATVQDTAGQNEEIRNEPEQDEEIQNEPEQNDADRNEAEEEDEDEEEDWSTEIKTQTEDTTDSPTRETRDLEVEASAWKPTDSTGNSDAGITEEPAGTGKDAQTASGTTQTTRKMANPIDGVTIILLLGIVASAFLTVMTVKRIRKEQRRRRRR